MVRKIQAVLPALLLASVITLSGCASKQDDAMKSEGEGMGAPESLDSKSLGILEGRTDGPMLPVYFEFDSSEIKDDQVARVENNADFLKKESVAIVVEGNCDPRGTNEYNMALGERRALSAKKYLVNLGVDAGSMTTVSYGEERIHITGSDEEAWAQNRRADFVIVK